MFAEVPHAQTFYAAGPVSRFLAWLEISVVRAATVITLVMLGLIGWAHAVLWSAGRLEIGTVDPDVFVQSVYAPVFLASAVVGRHIARGALRDFWPATGWPLADQADWHYRFANIPLRQELVALAAGLAVAVGALLAASPATVGAVPGRGAAYAALGPIFASGFGLTAVGSLLGARWVRLVAAIHREASAIDPFDRGPIYAFSRLTVFVSLTILAGAYFTFTANSRLIIGNLPALALGSITAVVALLAFIAPLWGIHRRLVRRKDELFGEVDRRIAAVGAELYAKVDAASYDQGKAINDTLAGLSTVRSRIRELPTWPWPPQLLRGFISALLLPVIVYILTRLAAGIISL